MALNSVAIQIDGGCRCIVRRVIDGIVHGDGLIELHRCIGCLASPALHHKGRCAALIYHEDA